MRKFFASILVIASMSFVPAGAAFAAQPTVTVKCATATYKVTLAFGKLNAAKAQYQAAKAARALAVKQKNPRGIATADAQMKRINLEIPVLASLYNGAVAAAKIACQ